jgi:hypothetical protein
MKCLDIEKMAIEIDEGLGISYNIFSCSRDPKPQEEKVEKQQRKNLSMNKSIKLN